MNQVVRVCFVGKERFVVGEERFVVGEERFVVGEERFSVGEERFTTKIIHRHFWDKPDKPALPNDDFCRG